MVVVGGGGGRGQEVCRGYPLVLTIPHYVHEKELFLDVICFTIITIDL